MVSPRFTVMDLVPPPPPPPPPPALSSPEDAAATRRAQQGCPGQARSADPQKVLAADLRADEPPFGPILRMAI
jgi:hypothetical protein